MGLSGIGMTSWNQVNELVINGVKVFLNVGTLEKDIANLSGLVETLRLFGFKIPIKPIGERSAARLHDRITANLLLSGKIKVDVVHCWPLGSEQTLRAAKKLGIKTFLERPNTHTRYAFEVTGNEYKKLGLYHSKKHTHFYNKKVLKREEMEYSLADYILCPSEFVANSFRLYGFPESVLALHHYGYDPEKFYPDKKNYQNQKGLKLIFVGRCEPRKGLHYALKAWSLSKASETGTFYICGEFVDGYRELLSETLMRKSVKIVGFTDNVASLLQTCDALILPTIEEGSALVTYEAMACGCTILVSDASGAHAEHMKNCLIHKAGNVDELVKHIDLIHQDRKFLENLKMNSMNNSKNLSWSKSALLLSNIYHSSLDL